MSNISLRRWCGGLAGVLTLLAANYYLNLGWLGSYGKLALSAASLFTVLFLNYMFRNWHDES
jgi:hypothetical protein